MDINNMSYKQLKAHITGLKQSMKAGKGMKDIIALDEAENLLWEMENEVEDTE